VTKRLNLHVSLDDHPQGDPNAPQLRDDLSACGFEVADLGAHLRMLRLLDAVALDRALTAGGDRAAGDD
jgi:hypothetical protein